MWIIENYVPVYQCNWQKWYCHYFYLLSFKNFSFLYIGLVCFFFYLWLVYSWKWSQSVSCLVVSDSCDLMDCSLPGSSVHEISQEILEWFAISFSKDLPDPETEPRSPALQADLLPSEPPRRSLFWTQLAIFLLIHRHIECFLDVYML